MTPLAAALVAALALAPPAPDPAAEPGAAFREAGRRYLEGDFDGAARGYQALADAGLDGPSLRYDLGNAWLRAGRPGKAAASWERALRRDPADAEARANLELIRRPFAGRLPWARPEPIGFRLAERVSDREAALALAGPWLLLWAILAVRLRAREGRRTALSLAAAAAGLAAAAGGLLVAGRVRELREPRAVVVAPAAPLREAPSPSLRPSLELPEAAAVRVVGAEGDFLRVRLPGGLEGYARRDDLEVVPPAAAALSAP